MNKELSSQMRVKVPQCNIRDEADKNTILPNQAPDKVFGLAISTSA